MRFAALGLLVAADVLGACSKPAAPRSNEITGTLSVAGAQLATTQCRPGRHATTFVEVVTAPGVLRFEDQKLFWNDEPLSCTRLDRSWGGGTRLDKTSYWRGTLSFDCKRGADLITGDLTLDCGNITAEERAQLDGQRNNMRDEQRKARDGVGSGAASAGSN
jgi:hypothetical protein